MLSPPTPCIRGLFAPRGDFFSPRCRRAVASLNTPYRPADPAVDIVEKMKSIPTFDYQFYFQEPVSWGVWGGAFYHFGAQSPPEGGMCPCWAPQLV